MGIQSDRNLSGLVAILAMTAALSGIGGWYLAGGTGSQLDPVAAYCRGFSDGVGRVLMDQGRIGPDEYAEGAPIVDERCAEDLVSAEPTFTASLRGPLLADQKVQP